MVLIMKRLRSVDSNNRFFSPISVLDLSPVLGRQSPIFFDSKAKWEMIATEVSRARDLVKQVKKILEIEKLNKEPLQFSLDDDDGHFVDPNTELNAAVSKVELLLREGQFFWINNELYHQFEVEMMQLNFYLEQHLLANPSSIFLLDKKNDDLEYLERELNGMTF